MALKRWVTWSASPTFIVTSEENDSIQVFLWLLHMHAVWIALVTALLVLMRSSTERMQGPLNRCFETCRDLRPKHRGVACRERCRAAFPSAGGGGGSGSSGSSGSSGGSSGNSGGSSGSGRSVLANYHYYDERKTGDGSNIGSTACADNAPPSYLQKRHNWVAVNPPTFGLSEDGDVFRKQTCGKCLEVSGGNKTWKLLIVDIKGGLGIDVSQHAWNNGIGALSKDGGNATVRAAIVNC